ncbi:hypothetical protein [Rudanella lutea]|uniref:hypothetical protein n=1 Tax=Rudanella lutea TaxID=451374 RepID=UPI00036B4BA8|nr:hypothetical protein [Rudanella lutea]
MYKLETKKIVTALKSLENAAKGSVRALNEMTNNEFVGSQLEKDPLGNIGLIVRTLQNAQERAAANSKYAGMSAEEISAAQEAEREAARESITASFQQRLASRRKPVQEEPYDGSEPDPDATGTDTEA